MVIIPPKPGLLLWKLKRKNKKGNGTNFAAMILLTSYVGTATICRLSINLLIIQKCEHFFFSFSQAPDIRLQS